MKSTIIVLPIVLAGLFQAGCAHKNNPVQSEQPRIDSLVNAQLKKHNIPGLAVGIVKDGNVVLAQGFGYANVEEEIPVDKNTLFQLGSVTKMVTGYLLAILIQQEKMALSDTLARFFPPSLNFPESPTGQVVTVKQIATHSAEFPRYPENLQRVDPEPIRGYSKEEMLTGIERVRIDTVIGVRYNYSNFGYGVLGTAMENRMEKPLSALMEELIFVPYSMKNSSLDYNESVGKKLAVPYLQVAPYKRTEPWDMGTLSGAGNVFSTISDLNLFMIQLMSDEKVNSIQQTPYLQINDTWSYGLGCFIIRSQTRKTKIIYHGGDIDGYASSVMFYPEYNLGIAILTNWGEGQVVGDVFNLIGEKITDFYLGAAEE